MEVKHNGGDAFLRGHRGRDRLGPRRESVAELIAENDSKAQAYVRREADIRRQRQVVRQPEHRHLPLPQTATRQRVSGEEKRTAIRIRVGVRQRKKTHASNEAMTTWMLQTETADCSERCDIRCP
jgi:hypothetical protein